MGTAGLQAPMLTAEMRSKSFAGGTANNYQSTYSETVGEMKRLRSTRMDKHLSSTMKQARRSRIIPDFSGPGNNFRVEDEQDSVQQQNTGLSLNSDAITLEDIPRIVAAEQAKEQRPNAYRHAHNKLLPEDRKARFVEGIMRDVSRDPDDPSGQSYPVERTKKFFSELTALEYFIVRHVAVLQMQPMLEGHMTLEDLLLLIETRKQTFWNKLFKPNSEKPKSGKKKGVFGVALEVLVERDSVESEHGLGPGALRVPSIIDDAVSTMRQMDMSVEGVFRKNGNIRGLKDLAERIDSKEGDVDLSRENPVQVAALLKKFLRELPDPLLTHKLYDLFMISQSKFHPQKPERWLSIYRNSRRDKAKALASPDLLSFAQDPPRLFGDSVLFPQLDGVILAG